MFDEGVTYIFSEKKYLGYILSTGKRISSIEKNFAKKYDKERVKVINKTQAVVDNQYQVMREWCEEVRE